MLEREVRALQHRHHHHRPGLDPALDFLRLLWAVEHGLETTSKRMQARHGVTGPQRLVLRIIEGFPGISAVGLSRITWLHPSTLTGIVRRLERKGWLQRTADARDRRRARLRVTPAGRRLASRPGRVESAVREMLLTRPRQHIAHTRSVLWLLATKLDDAIAQEPLLPTAVGQHRSYWRQPGIAPASRS
jgi:DNA-binding MarR family transcriptional regulator